MATEIDKAIARDIAAGGSNATTALASFSLEGAKMTFGAGTATIAEAGTAVKVVATTAADGASNGFTVGTDNKITCNFTGTRLVHIRGVFDVDVASGADAVVLQIVKNGTTVVKETSSQNITAASLVLFGFDFFAELSENDYIELWAENEDAAVNVTTAAAAEEVDEVPEHGYLILLA